MRWEREIDGYWPPVDQRAGEPPHYAVPCSGTPEKKGSVALMVCVNDTATAPRLMLVSALPRVCTTASGDMFLICTMPARTAGWGSAAYCAKCPAGGPEPSRLRGL